MAELLFLSDETTAGADFILIYWWSLCIIIIYVLCVINGVIMRVMGVTD